MIYKGQIFIKINNTYIYTSIYSCLLPGTTNNYTPVAMSTPSPLILMFKHHSSKKETMGPWEEWRIAGLGQRQHKTSLEHLMVPARKEVLKK